MKIFILGLSLLAQAALAQSVIDIKSTWAMKEQVGQFALVWQCSGITSENYVFLNELAQKDLARQTYMDCAGDDTKTLLTALINTETGKVLIGTIHLNEFTYGGGLYADDQTLSIGTVVDVLPGQKAIILSVNNVRTGIRTEPFLYKEADDSIGYFVELDQERVKKESLAAFGWDSQYSNELKSMNNHFEYAAQLSANQTLEFVMVGTCKNQSGGYRISGEIDFLTGRTDEYGYMFPVVKNVKQVSELVACSVN